MLSTVHNGSTRTGIKPGMSEVSQSSEPWGEIWSSIEVLFNVEYLARTTHALSFEQKLYLDVMESELFRLTRSLNKLRDEYKP